MSSVPFHPYAAEIFFGAECQGTGEHDSAVISKMGSMLRRATWMATEDATDPATATAHVGTVGCPITGFSTTRVDTDAFANVAG